MKVLSVRKDGYDPNEFADCVLIQQPNGSFRPARPSDLPRQACFGFPGYNVGNDYDKDASVFRLGSATEGSRSGTRAIPDPIIVVDDNSINSLRAIDSIWRELGLPHELVACLWVGLGENRFEKIRFHKAIRCARRSAQMYAGLLNAWLGNPESEAIFMAHSLGCGVTGWILDGLHEDLVHPPGAIQHRTATGSEREDEKLARLAMYRSDRLDLLDASLERDLAVLASRIAHAKARRLESAIAEPSASNRNSNGSARIPAVIWMGAAVPQYATSTLDPRTQDRDVIGKLSDRLLIPGPDQHRFDFSRGLARNAGRLINFIGDDPVLKGPFELSTNQRACGAYGCWSFGLPDDQFASDRILNAIDIDVRSTVKDHSHYRHDPIVWAELKQELARL